MRGEYCIAGASFLSFAALLLLIFVHVGQINTSNVPHGISMAIVNVSGYGEALSEAFNDPIQGLYTTNSSSPLGQGAGIRQQYEFGLYTYCAYVNSSAGQCSNHTVAARFQPYTAITSDMLLNYSQFTAYIFVDTTFINSSYLGTNSHVAYFFLLLGTIFTALSLFTGALRRTFLFFFSATTSIISALFVLIGAAIWTAIVKKVESINTMQLSQGVVSGIQVSYGNGIYLSWAAFACLFSATIPYMISGLVVAPTVDENDEVIDLTIYHKLRKRVPPYRIRLMDTLTYEMHGRYALFIIIFHTYAARGSSTFLDIAIPTLST